MRSIVAFKFIRRTANKQFREEKYHKTQFFFSFIYRKNANLIWTQSTRKELRIGYVNLNEMAALYTIVYHQENRFHHHQSAGIQLALTGYVYKAM